MKLDFTSLPPQNPREVCYALSERDQSHLDGLVRELIDQGIAVPCQSPAFLAGLFVIPKTEGAYRLIVDLSPLNKWIRKEHFKMERLDDALDLLDKGDWMTKVDLSQAYYSVPIHKDHQPYLAFTWKGLCLMFARMCFGLSPAPRIFTKILKPILKWMRRLGAKIVGYIDDFWLAHHDFTVCKDLTLQLIAKLEELGFMVNMKKSIVSPTKKIKFLGMNIMSDTMELELPTDKRVKIVSLLKQILRKRVCSTREMSSLLGTLEAIRSAFPMTPLYYRAIQSWSIENMRRQGMTRRLIPLTDIELEELRFWVALLPSLKPRKLTLYQGSATQILSDASLTGWGATVNNQPVHGLWTPQEKGLHINTLELLAVEKTIIAFQDQLYNKNVILRGDNVTMALHTSQRREEREVSF